MIEVSIQDRIATILLNRPEKRNALNNEMVLKLHAALLNLRSDDQCKIVIIKAKGEAFCAGADLAYLQDLQSNTYEQNLADSQQLMEMFSTLYHFPKITIAQVEGAALAGGCGLSGLCDFCYATPNAQFGYTEVKIGFIPAIVSVFLTRKIGENLAKQLLLTGDIVSASEAHTMHLITKVVDNEEIDSEVLKVAQRLIKSVSSDSIRLTKKLLSSFPGMPIQSQLDLAAVYNAKARATDDCKKGIAAFLNKEKLTW
ncbi:MAG: enoyl-CoA hydratase-related protein [bacterium]|nr:enoyl-CoA hydratase-related protein [bacterium]